MKFVLLTLLASVAQSASAGCPRVATVVDNEGNSHPNAMAYKIDENTFVFGAAHHVYFKMVSVDAAGQPIESRHMPLSTYNPASPWSVINNWGGATNNGYFPNTAYNVENVQVEDCLPVSDVFGHYTTSSYNFDNNVWTDVSGNGRDGTAHEGQPITLKTDEGVNGVSPNTSLKYVHGHSLASVSFPAGSIPGQFTICSLSKYGTSDPTYQGRIITSTAGNWLHGHHHADRGVAYYEGWKANVNYGTSTDWLVMCGSNNPSTDAPILVNSPTTTMQNVKDSSSGFAPSGALGINTFTNQRSNWGVAEMIMFKRFLSSDEMADVSDYLLSKLSPISAQEMMAFEGPTGPNTQCDTGRKYIGNVGMDACKAACVDDPTCGGIGGALDVGDGSCWTCSVDFAVEWVQYSPYKTYRYTAHTRSPTSAPTTAPTSAPTTAPTTAEFYEAAQFSAALDNHAWLVAVDGDDVYKNNDAEGTFVSRAGNRDAWASVSRPSLPFTGHESVSTSDGTFTIDLDGISFSGSDGMKYTHPWACACN